MNRHGTMSDYNMGCRCDECRQAARDYAREYKRRKDAGEPFRKYTKHRIEHGLTVYRDKGCRCEICVAANCQQLDDLAAWRRHAQRAPIGPLLERAASVAGLDPQTMSHRDIGKVCGVDQAQITRWVNTGSLPFRNAEKIAIHLGWHPAGIWGVDWYLMEEAA